MKKSTKKLLTLALSTLFVGAGLGGAVATYNALDAKVAAAEELPANFVDISGEIYNTNTHGIGDWGTCGDYKEAGLYRFWLDEDKVLNWTDGGKCLNDGYPDLLNYIKVNGKTVKEWRDLYAAGQTNAITWTNMPDNGEAYPHTMQANIAADVIAGRATYAPIFVMLTKHGDLGSALDIYIPVSFMPEVNSIEFLKGFEWEYNEQTFGFSTDVIFKMTSFGKSGKQLGNYHANVIETTVTGIDGTYGATDQFLSFKLGTNDYGDLNTASFTTTAEQKAYLRSINYFDHILIDGQKLGTTWNGVVPGEVFFNVWGRKDTFSTRWPEAIRGAGKQDSVQEITILAGCQFPSANDPFNTVYEVKKDVKFTRAADGSFALVGETPEVPDVPDEPEVPELAEVDITNISSKTWGKGDYAGNMAHIRLNIAGDVTWTAANKAANNATLPASVLDNVWVNGKSISQHNAEYKALIESGADSPITWDPNIAFNAEIAGDVNNNTAVFAPIFIKLVNHGAGLPGNTIDMYIPNSYLPVSDITELRITKDFLYETETAKFTVSDDVIFKSNSLCVPDKYIGEANLPQLNLTVEETTVEKVMGNISGDAMLSFYLGTCDYPTSGDIGWTGSNEFLKNINYYDYIEFDGVKLGTLWNKVAPGEKFTRVWGRQNAFTTRWPTNLTEGAARENIQKITVLAGAQFPSAENVDGKVYEVKETVTFINMGNGEFVREDYLIYADDLTITKAADAGDAMEMIAFEIKYANWNATRDSYDFNYNGDQFTWMRKNIFLNGVSLWDINMNTDDSGYNYVTSPWTNDGKAPGVDYQLFQNPTLVRGAGDTVTVYVHKDYLTAMGINVLNVTIAKNFCHADFATYVVAENITAKVWAKPVTVTLLSERWGETSEVLNLGYGDKLELPTLTAEHKNFLGWFSYVYDETIWDDVQIAAPEYVTENLELVPVWEVIPYTVTVKHGEEVLQTITFGVEYADNVDTDVEYLPYMLEYLYPADTRYSYQFVGGLPEVFECKDYTLEVETVMAPQAYNAFKFGMYQASLEKTLYLTGEMDGYYLATSENAADAVDFYAEKVEGGYRFYKEIDYVPYYIEVYKNGTYTNIGYKEEANSVFVYDAECNCWYTTVDGVEYYLGTYGTFKTVSASKKSFINAENTGVSQFVANLVQTYSVMIGDTYMNAIDGTVITLETPTAEGKEFLGWTDVEGNALTETTYTINGEGFAAYATWNIFTYNFTVIVGEETYNLTFGVEGDWMTGRLSIDDLAWKLEELLPATTDAVLYKWAEEVPETFELKDYTFTAVAEDRIYEVTLITDRFAIPTTVSGKYGEAIDLTAPTAEGKVFAGWIDIEGNAVTEATFSADIQALYATWTITPYTLTVVNGDETTTITFGVMADPTNGVDAEVMTLGFILENMLPADSEEFTYAWAEEIPAEFGLQNYTFTVVATAVEQPEPPVHPEQPGTSEEPEQPGTSEEPEEPGTSEEPEEPTTSDEPTDEPEEPSASEEPSILDQVTNMVPGCSGVVGGIAGVAALGIAAVALLKKKEDNE